MHAESVFLKNLSYLNSTPLPSLYYTLMTPYATIFVRFWEYFIAEKSIQYPFMYNVTFGIWRCLRLINKFVFMSFWAPNGFPCLLVNILQCISKHILLPCWWAWNTNSMVLNLSYAINNSMQWTKWKIIF